MDVYGTFEKGEDVRLDVSPQAQYPPDGYSGGQITLLIGGAGLLIACKDEKARKSALLALARQAAALVGDKLRYELTEEEVFDLYHRTSW